MGGRSTTGCLDADGHAVSGAAVPSLLGLSDPHGGARPAALSVDAAALRDRACSLRTAAADATRRAALLGAVWDGAAATRCVARIAAAGGSLRAGAAELDAAARTLDAAAAGVGAVLVRRDAEVGGADIGRLTAQALTGDGQAASQLRLLRAVVGVVVTATAAATREIYGIVMATVGTADAHTPAAPAPTDPMSAAPASVTPAPAAPAPTPPTPAAPDEPTPAAPDEPDEPTREPSRKETDRVLEEPPREEPSRDEPRRDVPPDEEPPPDEPPPEKPPPEEPPPVGGLVLNG